ncbi:hypothetical protein MKQ68_15725 [Chitinophaga horti]|uniref:Serine protease n=1 Tax=Chitinophaga horti TaxID=2920382 RepID=A0ABY6IW72_9BACT|nr:hypothetical protein [Chitinophaga horti]UYQ91540.1 hypothetical protein MKQ68_15725 [Chitinophaga horti]
MKLFFALMLFAHIAVAQQVSYASRSSLLVRIFADTVYLGSATGFVVEVNQKAYFITNWHVVTNREYNGFNRPLMSSHVPDRLWIHFNRDTACGRRRLFTSSCESYSKITVYFPAVNSCTMMLADSVVAA